MGMPLQLNGGKLLPVETKADACLLKKQPCQWYDLLTHAGHITYLMEEEKKV
jgi:hypothetical protein